MKSTSVNSNTVIKLLSYTGSLSVFLTLHRPTHVLVNQRLVTKEEN